MLTVLIILLAIVVILYLVVQIASIVIAMKARKVLKSTVDKIVQGLIPDENGNLPEWEQPGPERHL